MSGAGAGEAGRAWSQLSDHLVYLIIRNFRWKSPGGLLPPASPQQFRQLVHMGFGRTSDQLAGPQTDATPAADGSLFRYDFYLNSAVGNTLQGNCEMDPFSPCCFSKSQRRNREGDCLKGVTIEGSGTQKHGSRKTFNLLQVKSVSLFTFDGEVNINQLLFRKKNSGYKKAFRYVHGFNQCGFSGPHN